MKKTFAALSAAIIASTALCAAELTSAELNSAVSAIRNKHKIWGNNFRNDEIVKDLKAFAATNSMSPQLEHNLYYAIIEAAALLEDMSEYESALSFIGKTPDAGLKKRGISRTISQFNHLYAGGKKWRLAQDLYGANEGIFSAAERANFLCAFAQNEAKLCSRDRYRTRVAEIENMKAEGEDAAKFEPRRVAALLGAIKGGLSFDNGYVLAKFEEHKALFTQEQMFSFYCDYAKDCVQKKDRKGFDEILAKVRSYGLDERHVAYADLIGQLFKFEEKTALRLLDEELSLKEITPEIRQHYLSAKRTLFTPHRFDYGFNKPGKYRIYRETIGIQFEIEKANPDSPKCRISDKGWMPGAADLAIWHDDLDFAERLLDAYAAHRPGEAGIFERRAQICALRGDAKGCAKMLKDRLSLRGANNAATTNSTELVLSFLEGNGLGDFRKACKKQNLSDKEILAALRKTSRTLFSYRMYDGCRDIWDEIFNNMYDKFPKKIHTATYVPNGPKTADGFARSPLYGEWDKMEASFYPYGDGYGMDSRTDETRNLKGVKKPEINPEYKTGIRVTYDDEGVHIFMRCLDPGIEDVKLGKRTAGDFELFFSPGGLDKPYHSIFMSNLPATEDPHMADWAMPGKGYRLTEDAFVKDAVLTDDGVVAHLGIPWISFYHSLPVEGNLWNFGCIRGGAGGMQTIGGHVHELSRGLRLKFNLTEKELVSLKRKVAIQAFNRYSAIRKHDGKFIKTWNDPVLGDPAFFEKKVAPLLESLNKAGERLLAPCADGEVAGIFAEFVPQWAEIEYVISSLRSNYVNDWLFDEQQ